MNRAPDGYKGNLAKPSGKKPAFMFWVDLVAKAKFRRHNGIHLDMRNDQHMAVLREWHGQLTPEERETYKKMEKGEINAPKQYLERRHHEDGSRRDRMANDPHAYLEAKQKHKERVHQLQDEMVRQQGPIHIPKAKNMFMSNPLYVEHYLTRRSEMKQHLTEQYKFMTKDRPADIILNMKYAFIGATPACSTIVKENMGERTSHIHLTLPLELSIVEFSLAEGILEKSTFHMNVDPEMVFHHLMDYEDLVRQRERTQAAARKFGLSHQFTNRDHMQDAWFFVKQSVHDNSRLVCDVDNFNYVMGALHLLANDAGNEEAYFNEENFYKKLLPIQDLACILRNIGNEKIPDSAINTIFARNDLQPTDTFCSIHGKMNLDDPRRLYCQEGRAAMNIQKLIDFLRSENLHTMHTVFDPKKHAVCTELVGTSAVPNMPKHPLMSTADAQGVRRLEHFMFSDDEEEDEDETIDAKLRQEMNQNFRGRSDLRHPESYHAQPSPSMMRPSPVAEDRDFEEPPPPQLGATTRTAPAAAQSNGGPLPNGGFEKKAQRYSAPAPFEFYWRSMSDEEFARLPSWKEFTRNRF